jgi:hypothetical protein
LRALNSRHLDRPKIVHQFKQSSIPHSTLRTHDADSHSWIGPGADFALEGVDVETLGLCRAEVDADRAAFPLYEYDAIIINPQSFSHFLFGAPTEHSALDTELFSLKREKDAYDIDSLFDQAVRETELVAAIERGATVVWCLSPSRRQNMFGYREMFRSPAASKPAR